MNRRDFSKIIVALPSIAGPNLFAASEDLGYIDTHCHVWAPGTRPPEKGDFTYEDIAKMGAPIGVSKVVIVVVLTEGNLDYALSIKDKNPGKIGIIALIDPTLPDLAKQMEINRSKGILGYRINSKFTRDAFLEQPGIDNMWDIAANLNVSMCLLRHAGVDLQTIKDTMKKHPKTKVVIDHLGHVNPSDPAELKEFLKLADNPNCYLKVSKFFTNRVAKTGFEEMQPMLKQMWNAFGSERLMWGSNAPVEVSTASQYQGAFKLIRDSEFFSKSDKENIFKNTAEKLFF